MNIIFGIIFFFFIWSFLTAILTDPGRVPLYWVNSKFMRAFF